jgi:undecaprenyl diphosphate synthase
VKTSELLPSATKAETALLEKLDLKRLPRHVAIIMDGNGRWAQRRHLPRVAGHRAGVAAARETIETSARIGIGALTLYAFSVENWRRPKTEVNFLMSLLREYLRKELPVIHENNIRLRVIGRADELPAGVREDIERGMELTAKNTGMGLIVALNYGARAELVDAFNSLLDETREHTTNGELQGLRVTEEMIAEHLYTAGIPDPDLLIRTSGELRISNFLLWQIAYAELYVTDVLWPDFNRSRLLDALIEYQRRERRYGGLGRDGSPHEPR